MLFVVNTIKYRSESKLNTDIIKEKSVIKPK